MINAVVLEPAEAVKRTQDGLLGFLQEVRGVYGNWYGLVTLVHLLVFRDWQNRV
jgi:hypothetical protein